jgi:thiol-disulfide isomerase/thioredoxin
MRGPKAGWVAAVAMAVGMAAGATAQETKKTLGLGDKAPALAVDEWVKGEKVEKFEEGKIYVVEFWATWCGPCKVTIPHLTELQKANPEVAFIGVSIMEEDQANVKPFVEQMGDQMDYRVAVDKVDDLGEGAMAAGWMEAAGQGGIPTAFIVGKDGKIAWIGHPGTMDKPLEKIKAGEWDLAAEAKKAEEEAQVAEKIQGVLMKLAPLFQAGKFAEVLKGLDAAFAETPEMEEQLAPLKFNLLVQLDRADEAAAYGKKLLEGPLGENEQALNEFAWSLVDPDRQGGAVPKPLLAFALEAAQKASELTDHENPAILDTLALAYFLNGQPAKALEYQEKAVELSPEDGLDPAMKERLEQYRKAVQEA